MADHDTHDHTGVPGVGTTVADILDLSTAETDDTLVLAPDGAGGVEFRAETGGGGGGGTQAYLGYNTVGASFQSLGGNTFYCRKITVPTGGGFLMSIDAYIKGLNDGGVSEYRAAIWDDSSGSPTNAREIYSVPQDSHYVGVTGRWFSFGGGSPFLAAGDYWIGIAAAGSVSVAYDTGGSTALNKTFASGSFWITDASQGGTITGVTNQHSVRANMLYV